MQPSSINKLFGKSKFKGFYEKEQKWQVNKCYEDK
jgi:hypothetical protein